MKKSSEGIGKLLLILGMYRSGTSALVLALNKLGYFTAIPQDLASADEFNPDGYWENLRMMGFNNHLLSQFGLEAFGSKPMPLNWAGYPVSDILSAQALYLINDLYAGKSFAGWKDPRTCALLPFYLDLFERAGINAKFVLTLRNPVHTANSLHRKDHVPFGIALGTWTHFMLSALFFVPSDRLHLVCYEDFLLNTKAQLEPVFQRFSFPDPSEKQWEEATAAIRSGPLRASESETRLTPDFVSEVYDVVKEIASHSDRFIAGEYQSRISDLWQTWNQWGHILGQTISPPAIVSLSASDSETKTVPSSQWTKVQILVHGQCGDWVPVSLARQIGIVSLKNMTMVSDRGIRVVAEWAFGPDAKGDMLSESLLRFVIYAGGQHLLVRVPKGDGPWSFETEVFAQLGQSYLRDPLIGLLRRAGFTK